ncbi:MAG: ATP-binding cassette domain-containing protein [Cyclobacteriaceae bacterium]|nr:ATP-binding cassette domain-containing protein [Cyclobacteriaceae bacterium]
METVLSTHQLSKQYGRLKAVDKLDLSVPKGSVFGILGPNGSGKTTTLGMLLDVIQPTGGSYDWFGKPGSKEQRKKIGAILETPIFYPYLSAVKNLEVVALIKEVSKDRIPQVIEQVGLSERQHDKYRTYSLGMKQRLSIASALLCDPEVMILDEPTNGLDPQGIADIRQLIINIANEGKTIVLASHLLDEVQKVCTDFAVLKNGTLIYTGKVEDVEKGESKVIVKAEENLENTLANCPLVQGHIPSTNGRFEVTMVTGKTSADLNKYLFDKQVIVSHLETQTKSLEKQFLELLNENK